MNEADPTPPAAPQPALDLQWTAEDRTYRLVYSPPLLSRVQVGSGDQPNLWWDLKAPSAVEILAAKLAHNFVDSGEEEVEELVMDELELEPYRDPGEAYVIAARAVPPKEDEDPGHWAERVRRYGDALDLVLAEKHITAGT